MLTHSSVTMRRGRQVYRIAAGAAAAIRQIRVPMVVHAFWWDGHPNFGDALTPWLLRHFAMTAFLRPATTAAFVGVGSILEMLPEESQASIWGSGLMYDAPRRFEHATALAVRGPLTRDLVGLPGNIPLGDPGLLVSRFRKRPVPSGAIAAVPHGHHAVWPSAYDQLTLRTGVRRVRFDARVSSVIDDISAASLVVSSSLHGLIVADAYGIPAVWAVPTDTNHHVADFKYTDYHAALGMRRSRFDLTPETTVDELRSAATTADADTVQRLADTLQSTLVRWRENC